ncbi:MAG: serine/threonine protein kinase [Segetibacter sp.]|nr:serine/threonine protein kinase [Segetibacter sp.]
MAKVFTITQGLQNMGALKTGGQGSVYKGRRVGEIITAVKLLPTPLLGENEDDKNYLSFKNEVEKLKRVNEEPNPNVVKILSSGITDSGNFPFIEMEYIEGPELGDLLKPPHDPIFTIKETLKVAEHLSHALAHCHKMDVKHGDIKSNNIKYNIHSGNYILLDFGLSAMSDEQRRSSLRNAGAIEFMAPEQNEGQVFFQTDIYSFGILLYELLAGRVPFPLQDNGGTARNNVRIAHMESAVPDLVPFRKENLPVTWPDEKKEKELQIPEWLLNLIKKCLEKDPKDRFANGTELSNYIIYNITVSGKPYEKEDSLFIADAGKLWQEKQQLEQQLQQLRQSIAKKEEEIGVIEETSVPPNVTYDDDDGVAERQGVSRPAFFTVLIFAIALAAFAGYTLFNKSDQQSEVANNSVVSDSTLLNTDTVNNAATAIAEKNAAKPKKNLAQTATPAEKKVPVTTTANTTSPSGKFKVLSKAFFHNEPDPGTRREAFINHWNKAVLTPLREEKGYIYVIFTNHKGQTSKGWLRKSDLAPAN